MNTMAEVQEATRWAAEGTRWWPVCKSEDVLRNAGVAVLLEGLQIAIFRYGREGEDRLYGLSNFDPFGRAFVLSRGILGDRKGVPKVASPLYKQNFCLATGVCLDDPKVKIPVYAVRERGGVIEVEVGGAVRP